MLTDAQIQEGLKDVAEYMNFGISFTKTGEAKWADWDGMKPVLYAESWDWQIPVWSKLISEIYKDDKLSQTVMFKNSFHDYGIDTMLNEPNRGFEIILSLLTWYKNNKV